MRSRHERMRRGSFFFNGLVLVLLVLGVVVYCWPVPALKPVADSLTAEPPKTVTLAWPDAPEAAIGAIGYGLLAQNGAQTPRPIASTAKLITALTVLKKYPLTAIHTGPVITLNATDVALYNKYVAENGSVVPVVAGEQISERQMLEAMMLPSANNMADSLAVWAYGSLLAYKTAATQYIQSLGLNQTVIGSDASGFSPDTKSTAADLILLGQAALANPSLAGIVSEKQATLPLAGMVQNVNWLLGANGVIGIKTGNTDQAGGVFIFAAKDQLDASHSVTIIGSIVGSSGLQNATDSAVPLINSIKQGFVLSQVASTGQNLGHYKVPWVNQPVPIVTKQQILVINWLDNPSMPTLALKSIKPPQADGTTVGQVNFKPAGSVGQVVLKQSIPSPPWWWRLIRHKF